MLESIGRVIPALGALRGYGYRDARQDVLAGLTVAAVAVPQAMAYAMIAGLPAEYGLYTAIVMTAVGAVLDSSRQLINGPTNAISIALLSAIGGFASNGFGDFSPGKYAMTAAFVCEVVMTFVFLMVILGATDDRAPKGFAPIAIGLCLTLIHLISIPVTNTSVNPARSTSQAIFAGGDALAQLWLFWVAPIIGAALAGIAHKALFAKK